MSSTLSPVSSSIFTPVSSTGNLTLVSNNFSSASSLGNLSPLSGSISLLGDTNLQDTILETSNFGSADSEIDVATDEGYIEYGSLNNTDESQSNNNNNDEDSNQDSGETVVNNSAIISPTNQDDNIIGGLNDTEFLFDLSSSNIGGNDVLSDHQGTTS